MNPRTNLNVQFGVLSLFFAYLDVQILDRKEW